MPAGHPEGRFRLGRKMDAALLQGDGGGGLEGRPEDQGHAVGNAAEDTAGVIGGGDDFAIPKRKGIVILAAGEGRRGKAFAELHALDGGDAEDQGGETVFHAAEDRVSQAGGQSLRHGLRPGRR